MMGRVHCLLTIDDLTLCIYSTIASENETTMSLGNLRSIGTQGTWLDLIVDQLFIVLRKIFIEKQRLTEKTDTHFWCSIIE